MMIMVSTYETKFALAPTRCRSCKKIIWMEHYLRCRGVPYHERIRCGKCLGWDN